MADFITMTLDTEVENISTDLIFETICHELGHAVRWGKNDEYADTLLKGMLGEGIATAVSQEAMRDKNLLDKIGFYETTVENRSNKDNDDMLELLKNELNISNYNYPEIFFNGNKEKGILRWTGYSVGYYLFKKYLKKTNKIASEAFSDKYDDIIKIVL